MIIQSVKKTIVKCLTGLAVLGLLLASGAGCTGSQDQKTEETVLVFDAPWIRIPAEGRDMTAAYLSIENKGGEADSLLSVTSPLASRFEMHETLREGDIMRMRPVTSLPVPAQGRMVMAPGGIHIMVFGVKQPLVEGQVFPLILHFEKAGEMNVDAKILQKKLP